MVIVSWLLVILFIMIIFLYGEDAFRSSKKLKELKDKFLEKNKSGLKSVDFSENQNFGLEKIKEAIGEKSLFSEKQLIIFKNFLSLGAKIQTEILEYLKKEKTLFEDKDTVLIFWEKVNLKKGNKLFEFLEKESKKQKFEILGGAKLTQWIENQVKEINPKVSISKKATEKLILLIGSDLLNLQNEIEKISNYKNEGIIKEEDVDILVKGKINSNIFETIEAISSGNKKKAIDLFHKQLKSNPDPFYILSMYVFQIRNLLKIEDALAKTGNQYEIAKITKLHPFVVQKGIGQSRFFGKAKLKNIFRKLQEIDLKVKTGKAEIVGALEKFIVEI